MKTYLLLSFLLSIFISSLTFAQVEESHVDFTLSPALMQNRQIQVAYEWLDPHLFRTKEMAITDLPKVSYLQPDKNHTIAAKVAFIANRSFSELSFAAMGNSGYISKMLNAVSIKQKSQDTWQVTNKVRAYSLPFRVTFDFQFREVSSAAIGPAGNYFKDEASGVYAKGRERFLVLDMSNFTQLMYRNYSIVYMKEIGPRQTLVVSTVIAALNKDMADTFFEFPPFSSTRKTMMGNFRTQILHMVREIQN